jgi:hypothetical protein
MRPFPLGFRDVDQAGDTATGFNRFIIWHGFVPIVHNLNRCATPSKIALARNDVILAGSWNAKSSYQSIRELFGEFVVCHSRVINEELDFAPASNPLRANLRQYRPRNTDTVLFDELGKDV